MLDITLFRDEPDAVREGLRRLGQDAAVVDQVRQLDERWRELVTEAEQLKAERNRESKKIGGMEEGPERRELIERMRDVGERIDKLDADAQEVRAQLDELLLTVPNIPDEQAPDGLDEEGNVVVRTEGELPEFDFEPRPHWELGQELGILDFERGVKLSGSRFYVMLREGVKLQRALINWMLDLHVSEHGYVEAYPPFVVNRECLTGTGQLPKFAENLYRDAADDLWLIPTAEVPLTNLHRDEILDAEDLPLYYTAYTACFRREKMSAGKDVRGIKRGHQFDKVEMVKFVTPESSEDELRSLLADAEDVCRRLGLPYRVKELAAGDMSFQAARAFDVEVWAAGCGEWLEVSSCSNCRSFQARRVNVRYRPADGGSPEFVHTLNGSGIALPRTVIAILENCQQADGSVRVPEALRPYMGGLESIGPR
ncbi:MAG: serine--tRNA ligase [Candidatus Brocadiia bacterium]